jgi:hypothetical protein
MWDGDLTMDTHQNQVLHVRLLSCFPATNSNLINVYIDRGARNTMSLRQGFGKQACEICGNVFTKRDHLDRHVRTHTRENVERDKVIALIYVR